MVGQRRELRTRLGRELRRLRVEEVCVREDVGAAHAAADLVQLREPERIGALDDERVGLRNVDARFDDRRRHEHVRIAREECVHPLLELPLGHLPVRDEEAEFRTQLLELPGRLVDRLDAVVQVERLPAARMLALESASMSSSSYSPTVVRTGGDRPAASR